MLRGCQGLVAMGLPILVPSFCMGRAWLLTAPSCSGFSVWVYESRTPGCQAASTPFPGIEVSPPQSSAPRVLSPGSHLRVGGRGECEQVLFCSLHQGPFIFSDLFPHMSSREPQFPFRVPVPVLRLPEVRLPCAPVGTAAFLATHPLGSQLPQ